MLKPAELERLTRSLEAQLEAAEHPLHKLNEIAVESFSENVDRSQWATDRDLTILRLESNSSRMQDIRLALSRISDGSYGTCLSCDETISLKRLTAMPWAAYCIKCQEAADKERGERALEDLGALMHMRSGA